MFKDGVRRNNRISQYPRCNGGYDGNYPIIKKLIEKEIDEDQAIREFIVMM